MTTTTANTLDTLRLAARTLAGLDSDYAQVENGVGYSKSDGSFGHLLAETPIEAWTAQVARSAWLMLRKYKVQLGRAGIDFDTIPEPPDTGEDRRLKAVDHDGTAFVLRFPYDPDLIDTVKRLPGRRWDGTRKVWTCPNSDRLRQFIEAYHFRTTRAADLALAEPIPEGEQVSAGFVVQRGPRLIVHSPYNPDLIARIREISGRRWEAAEKVWAIPLLGGNTLRQIATEFGLEWRVLEVEDIPNTPVIAVVGGRFTIRFEYDRDLAQEIREIPGADWDRNGWVFTVPLTAAIDLCEFVRRHESEIDASAEQALATAQAAFARIASSAATDAEIEIPGLGGDLLPFQRAGVRYALDALGFSLSEAGDWVKVTSVTVPVASN